MRVSEILLSKLQPAVLLITLGDQGMLLAAGTKSPFIFPRSRKRSLMSPVRATRSSPRLPWRLPRARPLWKRLTFPITPPGSWWARWARLW